MDCLGENSLISTIISLYILILLYFPCLLHQFIFSPIILSTFILLLYLLRLGASQKSTIDDPTESDSAVSINSIQIEEFLGGDNVSGYESDPKRNRCPLYADSFVEWDVRAPLEVIYEEYEGEDGEDLKDWEAKRESQMNSIERYASLSLFYPESDSDGSSEGDFARDGDWGSSPCFRWEEEEEDDRDGLIEIALDEKRHSEVDEENLIEIDLEMT